jgi:uncharacterized protein (DUF1800 family)
MAPMAYAEGSGMTTPQPTRRSLLGGAAALAATAVTGLTVDAALATPAAAAGTTDLVSADPLAHLLRRATFGPTPATLAEAAKLGPAGWLDRQLNPATIDDATCDALLVRLPLANADIATVRAKLPVHSYEAFRQLGRAAVARAAWSNRQLFEVTAMFWANHLHVAAPSSGVWDSRADYDKSVIRTYAFGRFADMLKASARHPAMLTYLDNRSSTKAHPNENYARELMELHTVGMIYTEADVQAAARLLTGLTVDSAGTYTYSASKHATGAVTVLGFSHPNAAADGGEAASTTSPCTPPPRSASPPSCAYASLRTRRPRRWSPGWPRSTSTTVRPSRRCSGHCSRRPSSARRSGRRCAHRSRT